MSWGLGVVEADDEQEVRAHAAGDTAVTGGVGEIEVGRAERAGTRKSRIDPAFTGYVRRPLLCLALAVLAPAPALAQAPAAGPGQQPAGAQPQMPVLSLPVAPTSARRFADRGVRARIECSDPCHFRVELRLDARTAIRLGLPRRHVRTGWRQLPAGEHTTLTLRPRGAARFRRAGRGARLTVRLITTDGRTDERAFRLTRR